MAKASDAELMVDGKTPFVINPIACTQVAQEDVNIRMNRSQIKAWIRESAIHDDKVIICSAGPSLEKYVNRIKEYQAKGWKVSCVKHSLSRLVNQGITPDFCVVLDPRCVVGKSTHGVKRLDLYKNTPDSVVFLVASVTDFRTVDYLLANNKRVVGWHRFTAALQNYPDAVPALGGGSCSALGSLGLFYTLGFRETILVGFDSSYESEDAAKLKTFNFGSKYEPHKSFIATGELGAQAQEIEKLLKSHAMSIKTDVWSDGLVGNIWRNMQNEYHMPDYRILLGLYAPKMVY